MASQLGSSEASERSEPTQPFPAESAPPKNDKNVTRIQQSFLLFIVWKPNTSDSLHLRETTINSNY